MKEAQQLLRRTFRASIVLAGVGIVYALTVPLLVPMLFGAAFGRSVLLGQVLSLGYCVAILANPLGVVGYALGLARITGASILFNLELLLLCFSGFCRCWDLWEQLWHSLPMHSRAA